MIIFDLLCGNGHAFEGWFASGAEFDRQKEARLVSCPVCDGSDIERRPSAKVRVAKAQAARPAPAPVPAARSDAIAGLPPELLTKLREVVRNTEDVGDRFPKKRARSTTTKRRRVPFAARRRARKPKHWQKKA
jgi:hypothetical protein